MASDKRELRGDGGAKPDRGAAGSTQASVEAESERMQRAISERARRFGLSALLDALGALGYGEDEIQFASHATSAHQTSVVEAVHFARPPQRRAHVILNIGLLAAQSPLPSYFQQVIERQHEGALTGFLNFFSHHLLSQLVLGQFPERHAALLSSWSETLSDVRSMLGLRTTYALHWIFDQVFPELGVSVQRINMTRTVSTRSVRLGPWQLGDGAALGGQAQIPVSGIAIKLFADEAASGSGEPWPKEAERRMKEQIIPLLAGHGIHLQVALVLRDQRNFLVLRPREFLGYVPLHSGPAAKAATRSVRTVILWNGEIPSASSS